MIFCASFLCAVAARLVSIITLGTFQKLDTCYAATSRDQSRAAPAPALANFMNERKYEEDEEREERSRGLDIELWRECASHGAGPHQPRQGPSTDTEVQ